MKTHTISSELAEPAGNLVEDAQELLAATAHVAEEKVIAARKRLADAMEKGKDAWRTVQTTAVSGAKATDRAIRKHPYQTIGIALGVGVILGYLVRRRN